MSRAQAGVKVLFMSPLARILPATVLRVWPRSERVDLVLDDGTVYNGVHHDEERRTGTYHFAERGVVFKCNDCNGEQKITFDDSFSKEYVEGFAGLMDGSSPFFVHKPEITKQGDPPAGFLGNVGIGQCVKCGGHFVATVFGFDEAS